MNLITLYCVSCISKKKHPRRIPSMKELLEVPTIPKKKKKSGKS